MRSRREQVDAHRFITSRMNQALVLANPDSVERPLRRIGVSIFASVMIMVLIMGGFMIAALLGKGNDPPAFNHIIFEKDTNAIYVYTSLSGEEDGNEKLWPVTNYTSALLLLKPYDGEPPTQNLKPESLNGYERGYTVGIQNAPPSPPPAESLLQDENWNACSLPATAGGMSGRLISEVVVEDFEAPDYLGSDRYMLVQARESDQQYVLWDDRKYAVGDEAMNALKIQTSMRYTVRENILHTIPTGPNLSADDAPAYFDNPSNSELDGEILNYGATLESQGQTYVLMEGEDGDDELAPIGEVSRALLESEYDLPTVTGVPSSEVSGIGVQAVYEEQDFPRDLGTQETLTGDQPALCSVFDPSIPFEEEAEDHNPKIALFEVAPETTRTAAGSVTIDGEGNIEGLVPQEALTVLPAGTAAIVASKPLGSTTLEGIRYLVDSTGIKYGIVDQGETGSTQQLLGYGTTSPVGIPDAMLNMIGEGVDLDPEDARSQLDPDEDPPVFDTGESDEDEGGE
ncbi:type VII secretion protein EccB [Glycomyces salinus]|uniref:type VII secretion protein EccB n=1 Tax=Glycomyces salinus TaxID=980294 RepID=UPI0018EA49AA|nr:type VII secretion protein EccB [Glycomyces salinus]